MVRSLTHICVCFNDLVSNSPVLQLRQPLRTREICAVKSGRTNGRSKSVTSLTYTRTEYYLYFYTVMVDSIIWYWPTPCDWEGNHCPDVRYWID